MPIVGMILFALLLVSALAAARARHMFAAVMAMSAFSLLSAVLFQMFNAVDVAITEAAVGVGASGVIMLEALALTGTQPARPANPRRRISALVALTGLVGVLAWGMIDLPAIGAPDAPIHRYIGETYLARSLVDTGIPNVVTAVLASYRGFDTLGETFVIFAAGIASVALLRVAPGGRVAPRNLDTHGLGALLPPKVAAWMLLPIIALFALYVQFHGDYSPGGGFQAGAVLAAALALIIIVAGPNRAARVAPNAVLIAAMGAGAALYAAVGFIGLVRTGAFLDYTALGAGTSGQHLGVLLVEIGVGVTVAGSLAAVFSAFAQRAFRAPR